MIAQFNTITGADWRHSLVSNRARIAQKRVATESFIRRARESRATYQFPEVINSTAAQRDNFRAQAETPATHGESL